jgi:hypothetical protein
MRDETLVTPSWNQKAKVRKIGLTGGWRDDW